MSLSSDNIEMSNYLDIRLEPNPLEILENNQVTDEKTSKIDLTEPHIYPEIDETEKYNIEINYEESIVYALREILTLPYYKNYAAHSGAVHAPNKHEQVLADLFKKHGFKNIVLPKYGKKNTSITRKNIIYTDNKTRALLLKDIPNGSFIEQPFGKQNNPDFIIKVSLFNIFFIEAKSSETATHPTYNSGGINNDFIYIFCNKKTNKTTIYKGDSIRSPEQQALIDEHIEDARRKDLKLNEKLRAIDIHNRGVCYYTRPMIGQQGGNRYTNYFAHTDRSNSENNAIEWVKARCQDNKKLELELELEEY